MQAVQNFLANYSANFHMALVLWPALSAILTLPILAYVYHRDGRLRLSSVVATYLAVLYVLGIGCFTLYPLPDGPTGPGITYGIEPNYNPLNFLADIAKDGLKAVFQLVFNVVFFIPLGFIAQRLGRMRLVPTILLGVAVSALVEIAQLTGLFGIYPFAYRCCDVDDLICNTLGALIGWLLAKALGNILPEKAEEVAITRRPGFIQRCVALWLDLTLVSLLALILCAVTTVPLILLSVLNVPFLIFLPFEHVEDLLLVIWVILFLGVEVLVPWFNHGSTPGGAFVRMTCETRTRNSGSRILFYVARTATLVLVLWLPYGVIAIMVLAIFYLLKRCMPYDLIP